VRARSDVRILFVGTRRGLEGRLVPDAGHRLAFVDMVPFAGRARVRLPYAFPRATMQCRHLLRTEPADVALGMGGYAGIPLVKAGRAHAENVEKALADSGGSAVARCVSFFDRIDYAYAAADLTVCRAGAGTVAELAVTGLPAVLVPYPYAPDDHQAVNASVLV